MPLEDSTHVAGFVAAARGFERWALAEEPAGLAAARQALTEIAALYSAGLRLSGHGRPADEELAAAVQVSEAERQRVVSHAARLPFRYYHEIFDPFPVPPEEPVRGDLADDLGDIYCDVVGGLRLYDRGEVDAALWQWVFHLLHHWGEHATSALRALQQYLADSDPEMSTLAGPRRDEA